MNEAAPIGSRRNPLVPPIGAIFARVLPAYVVVTKIATVFGVVYNI